MGLFQRNQLLTVALFRKAVGVAHLAGAPIRVHRRWGSHLELGIIEGIRKTLNAPVAQRGQSLSPRRRGMAS
jgi:hypothetical protein